MKYKKYNNNQHGFVAIFSVIFFALLAMVITVGFIRITVSEQQQALNNDLTARALAAAEAGVEDAKRALAQYQALQPGAQKQAFASAFESEECDGLYGDTRLQNQLDLNSEGQVAPNQELHYTCLDVDVNTDDFLDRLSAGESTVIPLRAVSGQFNTVNLEWHLMSDSGNVDGDGPVGGFFSARGLPRTGQFNNRQPPAYMRVQLIAVPNSGISRADLYDRSRTVFLKPSANGLSRVGMRSSDPRGDNPNQALNQLKDSPVNTECQQNANNGQYACQISLGIPIGSFPVNQNEYFLRITSLYRDTHLRARLERCQGGNCDPRTFEAVQARIDSTGKALDTFRRIETRVSLPTDEFEMLDFGLQTAGDICKQFQVSTQPNHYNSSCDSNPGE